MAINTKKFIYRNNIENLYINRRWRSAGFHIVIQIVIQMKEADLKLLVMLMQLRWLLNNYWSSVVVPARFELSSFPTALLEAK